MVEVGSTDRGSERNVAQIDDVSLPQVEEILEVVKNVSTERISEHAADWRRADAAGRGDS